MPMEYRWPRPRQRRCRLLPRRARAAASVTAAADGIADRIGAIDLIDLRVRTASAVATGAMMPVVMSIAAMSGAPTGAPKGDQRGVVAMSRAMRVAQRKLGAPMGVGSVSTTSIVEPSAARSRAATALASMQLRSAANPMPPVKPASKARRNDHAAIAASAARAAAAAVAGVWVAVPQEA